MEVLTKEKLRLRKEEIIKKILNGALFIAPTDTIYGISCNALNKDAVTKIRHLKSRFDTNISVWAPSKKWIKDNFQITHISKKMLEDLPGPYTLILKKKTTSKIQTSLNDENGVRLPDHWFSLIIAEANVPIVTTSANKRGESFMIDLDNLDPDIKKEMEFCIYEGPKEGRPSKIVNCCTSDIKER